MTIGGRLDAKSLALLAQTLRPTDDGLREAVRQLAQRGLDERAIGAALDIDEATVRRLVAASEAEAAEAHRRVRSSP
jgi:hypothetical protein